MHIFFFSRPTDPKILMLCEMTMFFVTPQKHFRHLPNMKEHSKHNLSHTWSNKWSELVDIGRKLFLVKITQVTNIKGNGYWSLDQL